MALEEASEPTMYADRGLVGGWGVALGLQDLS